MIGAENECAAKIFPCQVPPIGQYRKVSLIEPFFLDDLDYIGNLPEVAGLSNDIETKMLYVILLSLSAQKREILHQAVPVATDTNA
jgi:hypothetical protein